MNSTPASAIGSAASTCRPRPLGEHGPRDQRHDHDLDIREHRREARPDIPDRAIPEQEIDAEEQAGTDGEPAIAPRSRPVTAVLDQRDQTEDGQRVHTAEDRGRRRRCVRDSGQNGRECDRDRTEQSTDPHVGLGLKPAQHLMAQLTVRVRWRIVRPRRCPGGSADRLRNVADDAGPRMLYFSRAMRGVRKTLVRGARAPSCSRWW